MKLEINGRGLGLNGAICDRIVRDVNRFRVALPGIITAKVELSTVDTGDHEHRILAQVTLVTNGTLIGGEGLGPDATAALNFATRVVTRRLEPHNAIA